MSLKKRYVSKPFRFENLYQLIDCVMLFGASIARHRDGYRLKITCARRRWPALGWVLMVVEGQTPEFNFLRFNLGRKRDGTLTALTPESQFLGASYEKWYVNNHVRKPASDIERVFYLLGKSTLSETDLEWLAERVPRKVICI